MLAQVGRFSVHHRKVIIWTSLAVFLMFGTVGGGVADHLSSGGFSDPDSESEQVTALLEEQFGTGDPNFVLLVTAKEGRVDSGPIPVVGSALVAELGQHDGVRQPVLSAWTPFPNPALVSSDGTQALVLATIEGDDDEVDAIAQELTDLFDREEELVELGVTGFAPVFNEIGKTIEQDLARAEGIAIPITLFLLILVFGSVVAASLPLAIGAFAILGTFFVLRVVAEFTQVSIFALNMATAMGLGLAIDYSLFVVSRFREELRHGLSTEDAVVRTVDTAGRTVLFSALTVASSLSALVIFEFAFLRSFAYAGIPVVMLAAAGSIITLPAMLAALGSNVDKWAVLKRQPKEVGEGMWHRIAVAVMKRPLPVATSVILFLLFLGAPAMRIELGLPDDRVQAPGASTRMVSDEIRANFDGNEAFATSVIVQGIDDLSARAGDIADYAADLSSTAGVARVVSPTGVYVGGENVADPGAFGAVLTNPESGSVWLRAIPTVEPVSSDGEAMAKAVRAVEHPFEKVSVGGASAQLVDSKASMFADFPVAGMLIGIITFVVLFLMFGSVVVPLKAIVLNLLSLTATFGAMVWIFQDGNLSGFLDFTATGSLAITTPILMFCIAFGLSMDYEVFLLSRIKEEYDRTGDNQLSVAVGLEKTGRIVTAAAALISVVFIAMISSSVSFIKLFGLGLAIAVLVDATLVRATLVPAFMRLAGRANWWAPAALRRVHGRFGFSETGESTAVFAAATAAVDAASIDLTDSGAGVSMVSSAPSTGSSTGSSTGPTTANGDGAPAARRVLVAPGRPGNVSVVTPEERAAATSRRAGSDGDHSNGDASTAGPSSTASHRP
ncbi:MAG TPA: MMPL family transporter [Acidimicrobiales bacterium]